MHPEERRPLRHFNRFTREHQRHQGSHRRDKRADTEHRSDTLHRGYKREHRESEQHRSGHCRPETKERLEVMHQTNDGFKVAEYDLKARGPGDFLGKRQHGLPQLKIADLTTNMDLLTQAQQAAEELKGFTNLNEGEKQLLKQAISRILSHVGEQLN